MAGCVLVVIALIRARAAPLRSARECVSRAIVRARVRVPDRPERVREQGLAATGDGRACLTKRI